MFKETKHLTATTSNRSHNAQLVRGNFTEWMASRNAYSPNNAGGQDRR